MPLIVYSAVAWQGLLSNLIVIVTDTNVQVISPMSFIEKMRALFRASNKSRAEDLLRSVSQQLQELADTLASRIEGAASGRQGDPAATFEYIVRDRSGAELQTEWQDPDYVTYDDIVQTDGYLSLQQQARLLGVTLKLLEEEIEEVDDEDRLRFIIHVSGWG